MPPFRYTLISQQFISELSEITQDGESAVLLGPRYVGKRYVIHHLHRLWAAQAVSPVVKLQFMSEAPICTTVQLKEIVAAAVAEVAPDLILPGRKHQDPLAPIRLLAEREGRPVYLTAANVDGMAHHLARSFLQGIRKLVEGDEGEGGDAKIVAVMSGEDVFHELVYGPNSEFNCAYQYVLQSFTREEFSDCLRRYLSNMRLTFVDGEAAAARLFERSGGNTYILRIILWSILQRRTRHEVNAESAVTPDEIPDSFKLMDVPGAYGSHIFRRATQIIRREPDCWGDLEELLNSRSVPVTAGQNAPGRLELAGVGVRVPDPNGKRQHIQVSSPLMGAFLKQYYNPRRLGDLYASIGDWGSAFERYRLLETDEERKRPSGADDREDVEATISALSASLFRTAKKTNDDSGLAEGVKRLFVGGCNYVLGFPEVTFWHRPTWQKNPQWRPDLFDGYKPEKNVLRRVLKVLPSGTALPPGPLALEEPENKFAAAALLPAQRMDEQVAVVVSDFGQEVVISRERERLMKKLFEHFVEAYTHAIKVDELNMRLRARDEHVRIMNFIFRSLGEHDVSVDKVLKLAADGLLRLHHHRVLFSLVDPERRYIEIVLDRCADRAGNMEGRKWALKSSTDDIHPFVVSTKRPLIIPDATKYPVADKEFVRSARLKALAIVPLLNPAGEAVGAVLVERDNGALPSDREVEEDLKSFCNQLAIAIEQCERVNMLESGINKMPEPLIIVDATASPRYANKPAAELLGISVGWRDRNEADPLTEERDGNIAELVRESMSKGYRLAGRIQRVGRNLHYSGEVVADAIKDSRAKRVAGGLIRIQDRNYLHKYFKVAQEVAESNDLSSAMRNMLKAAEELGHKWGRLYVVKKEGGTPVFLSKMSFGYEEHPELAREFNGGGVRLDPWGPQSRNDWLCIDQRRPVVFCWLKSSADGVAPADGVEYVTPHGLRAINWVSPHQPAAVRKQPGDFWIDFPLITPEAVIGKMCLQCDKSMRPEDFELLKQLAENFSGQLEAFHRRDVNRDAREQTIRIAVAERIMATMAHNIGTRMMGLPLMLGEYKEFEGRVPEMVNLNDTFAHTLTRVFTTVERAKEMLLPDIKSRARVDIAAEIERTLSLMLPRGAWSVECAERPQEVNLDAHLFETALLEMVQNSHDAAPDRSRLMIHISVEPIWTPTTPSVTIVYKDNGPGVPEQFRERIFEDFFSRRPNRKTGTGLGLGFARRVVEAHGGEIVYHPTLGPGAAFVITLPSAQVNVQTQEDYYVSSSNS